MTLLVVHDMCVRGVVRSDGVGATAGEESSAGGSGVCGGHGVGATATGREERHVEFWLWLL